MPRTSQSLSSNASLLKSKASKHAIFGVVIALVAIGIATLGVAYMKDGSRTSSFLLLNAPG